MSCWSVPVRSSLAIAIASLVAACLVLACAAGPAGGSASMSPPGATPAASGPASGSTAVASAATADRPPQATLAAEGGDPVAGQLGSFIWADGGSDSPWLPGTPIVVGAGEPLTVTLGDGAAIATWSAKRVPAGTTDGAGAVGLGGGPAPATFPAPGPGSWSVQVDVTFASGLGAAVYYWQVTVR